MKEEELKSIAHYQSHTYEFESPSHKQEEVSVDWAKLRLILRRHWWSIFLFPLLGLLGDYFFLRYTKPTYQAEATLKLIPKIEAQFSSLGNVMRQEWDNLIAGELEVIRSPLIYSRIVELLPLRVSYHAEGRILEKELYRLSPFEVVEYEISDAAWYECKIYFEYLGDKKYRLKVKRQDVWQQYSGVLGKPLTVDGMRLLLKANTEEKTLQDINTPLYFIFHSDSYLYNYLQQNLEARIANQAAKVIQLSFRDYEPYKAYEIIKEAVQAYTAVSIDIKNKANKQKEQWLETKIQETEAELGIIEKEIEDFIISNKSQDIGNDLGQYIQSIKDLTKEKTLLEEQLSALRKVEQMLDDTTSRPYIFFFAAIEDDFITQSLIKINELKQQQAQLRLSVNENTLAYQKGSMQITALKEQSRAYIHEKRRYLLSQLFKINRQIELSESEFAGIPSRNRAFNKLQQKYSLIEKYYNELLNQKIQLGLAAAGTVPDFEVLSEPKVPGQPIAPNRRMIYLASLGTGVVLSLLWLVLQYVLHNTIESIQDLERLTHLPVLGSLPKSRKKGMEVSQIVVNDNLKSSVSEAFRTIRTNLDFMLPPSSKTVNRFRNTAIAISSTISGEGKTFTTLNLGAIIAMSGLKVILVDLDLRKPRLHLSLNLPNHSGASTLLSGQHSLNECTYSTEVPNLYAIPAGPIPPNPSELILNDAFISLLEALKETYDVVILDTPPVGLVTDGMLIMKHADLRIFVLRASYSKRAFIKRIEQSLKAHHLLKTGLVLNAVDIKEQGYGYGYGYGYYDEESQRHSFWQRLKQRLR